VLRTRAVEFSALKKMLKGVSRLQLDKVARREVQYRLVHAEKLLGETLGRLFNPVNPQTTCWVRGQRRNLSHATALNGVLSELCDGVYDQGLVLRNELINRRKLTSQGATAQGKLLKAMIAAPEQEHLGFTGNGPEVTMYASVLRRTGIHRQESNGWSFYLPTDKTVLRVWKLIDDFCLEAKTKPQSLGLLYQQLEAPPYGVKRGVIPVLLAAVLLYRADDVSVYKNGTFIPTLGSEHFELLVKDPSRFSVKYVQMDGLRVQVFRQLEELIVGKSSEKSSKERNATLLSVVKPLVKFANSIHPFTKQTRLTTPEAQAVLKALLRGQEPDHLLFHDLPAACGMKPLEADAENDVSVAQSLCDKLVTALRELRAAYDTHVLERGRQLLCDAFSSEPEHLQEDLRSRARRFVNNCIDNQLRQFLKAAVEEHKPDRQWLESLLFIVVNKPLTHWVDADITAFELNLNQLVKQLISLEPLQGHVNHQGSGFRAFKFTLTANNGNEKDDIAIIEQGDMETALEKFAQEILEDSRLSGDPKRQKALLAIMARQLLNMDVQTINELEAQRSKKQAAQSRSPKRRRSSN
jgi:hypothetical protein